MDYHYKRDSKYFKILHINSKNWLNKLMQDMFLKFLAKLFPNKFLIYKEKIGNIKKKTTNFFLTHIKAIFLRFKYPKYFLLPYKHIIAIHTLINFLKILKLKEFNFFLIGGTLLGAVRQKAFAGRPTDIDLGIKEDQFQQLLDAIPLLIKHGASYVRGLPRDNYNQLQVFFPHVQLIDITVYRKKIIGQKEMWTGEAQNLDGKEMNGIDLPIENLENLSTAELYGKTFLVPSNPEEYLEKKFGKNWRKPDRKQFIWKK